MEFDLSIGQTLQHLLHLCFFSISEDGLFTHCFLRESVSGFMGRRHCILELFNNSEYVAKGQEMEKKHLLYFHVQPLHLLHPAPVIVGTSDCVHSLLQVRTQPKPGTSCMPTDNR